MLQEVAVTLVVGPRYYLVFTADARIGSIDEMPAETFMGPAVQPQMPSTQRREGKGDVVKVKNVAGRTVNWAADKVMSLSCSLALTGAESSLTRAFPFLLLLFLFLPFPGLEQTNATLYCSSFGGASLPSLNWCAGCIVASRSALPLAPLCGKPLEVWKEPLCHATFGRNESARAGLTSSGMASFVRSPPPAAILWMKVLVDKGLATGY